MGVHTGCKSHVLNQSARRNSQPSKMLSAYRADVCSTLQERCNDAACQVQTSSCLPVHQKEPQKTSQPNAQRLTWCVVSYNLVDLLYSFGKGFRRLHELEQSPGQHCSCGLMPSNQHGHEIITQLLVINVCISQIYHEPQQTWVLHLHPHCASHSRGTREWGKGGGA